MTVSDPWSPTQDPRLQEGGHGSIGPAGGSRRDWVELFERILTAAAKQARNEWRMKPLKICAITSEVHPFSKSGGLADVTSALSRFLHRSGHDVRLFTPLHSRIDRTAHHFTPVDGLSGIPLRLGGDPHTFSVLTSTLPGSELRFYFIDCPAFYDRPTLYTDEEDEHLRFALLSRAAIESCQRMAWGPDVFHCHDWHASLVPIYLKTLYGWDQLLRRSRTVLTIHNIGYQGLFPASILPDLGLAENADLFHNEDLRSGRVNFLKTGILHADMLTTVSRTYALEIQTKDFGAGLHDLLRARRGSLIGILNGVDYDEWSPEKDRLIPYRYSSKSLPSKAKNKKALTQALGLEEGSKVPVLGVISRLTAQKGFELFFHTMPDLLERRDLRLAVLGTGEPKLEAFFERLQASFPGKVCFYRGFSNELAHLIEAGSDLFLMPSLYEPCGLNQMYSLKYGTVPVVRRTGGLADTVAHFDPATGEGTGFVFERFTPEDLRWALNLALETYENRKAWRRLVLNGMSQDYSWETQGREYLGLYSRLASRAGETAESPA